MQKKDRNSATRIVKQKRAKGNLGTKMQKCEQRIEKKVKKIKSEKKIGITV